MKSPNKSQVSTEITSPRKESCKSPGKSAKMDHLQYQSQKTQARKVPLETSSPCKYSPRKAAQNLSPTKPALIKTYDETNERSPQRRQGSLNPSVTEHNGMRSPRRMISISSPLTKSNNHMDVENARTSLDVTHSANQQKSPYKRKLDISVGLVRQEHSEPKKPCSPKKAPSWFQDSQTGMIDLLDEAQKVLRLRISQRNRPPVMLGYEKEKRQLQTLIRRTIDSGESNSLLLIGPRGCGKSMLVRSVVEDLSMEKSFRENMMLVQLNGLLQADDRIALREITRQLQLENTIGDKVFGSFAETLQFLLAALKKGDRGAKPILFVLEEFDMFAQHKNQTLLYNLFDVSQSAQAPICVVGITCRLDVIELLEKRVKSRFSHRQLYLFNNLTLKEYTNLCYSYLSLGKDFLDQNYAKQWNANIQSVLAEVSVKDILQRQFSLTNDVRGLLSLLTYPVCQVSKYHPQILVSDLVTSFKLLSTDTKSAVLHGVSTLELCLIIAMKHLVDIYDGEPFNFEMVYSEYLKFARRRSGMQVYEKAVVMKAYEHLQTLELIRCQSGMGQTQKEYKLMTLLVHPTQLLDVLQKYPGCPTEIKQWATQSI